MTDAWGADVPISMPNAPTSRPIVPMEGMAFSIDGLCHPITEEQAAALATPTYGPDGAKDG